MSEPVAPGARPGRLPLSTIVRAGVVRLLLAGCVIALAAAAMALSGAAGIVGPLGSVFGLHADGGGGGGRGDDQATAAPIAPPIVVARAPSVQRPSRVAPRVRSRGHVHRHRTPTAPQRAPAQSAPAPVVAPPPAAPPSNPSPAPGGNVEHTVAVVRDTVVRVAPPAQPVVEQAVQAVDRTCGLLGGCP